MGWFSSRVWVKRASEGFVVFGANVGGQLGYRGDFWSCVFEAVFMERRGSDGGGVIV